MLERRTATKTKIERSGIVTHELHDPQSMLIGKLCSTRLCSTKPWLSDVEHVLFGIDEITSCFDLEKAIQARQAQL
jgi:hypothetical protein